MMINVNSLSIKNGGVMMGMRTYPAWGYSSGYSMGIAMVITPVTRQLEYGANNGPTMVIHRLCMELHPQVVVSDCSCIGTSWKKTLSCWGP